MTLDLIRDTLGWCAVLNIALLLAWWLLFISAHDFIYRMHSEWFQISVTRFDGIHYSGMALMKTFILVVNIVPYLALRIAG
jgi:hypothetical protein